MLESTMGGGGGGRRGEGQGSSLVAKQAVEFPQVLQGCSQGIFFYQGTG